METVSDRARKTFQWLLAVKRLSQCEIRADLWILL